MKQRWDVVWPTPAPSFQKMVPDAPGFGLKIDEAKFAAGIKPLFDLKL